MLSLGSHWTEVKNYTDKSLLVWNGRNVGSWSIYVKIRVQQGKRWILHVRTVNKIQPEEGKKNKKSFALISKSEVQHGWHGGRGSQRHQWVSVGNVRALRFDFPELRSEWGTAKSLTCSTIPPLTCRSTVWFRKQNHSSTSLFQII